MHFTLPTVVLATTFSASVLAARAPHPRHERRHAPLSKRFTTLTSQYATEVEGENYLLSNNLWGMYAGSGSQSTVATKLSGDSISWSTTYTWSGASSSVKSYANVGITPGSLGVALKDVSSIPAKWDWSYGNTASSGLNADVSYDLWLSTDPSCGNAVGCSSYEIMVWLDGRGGCTPAGSNVGTVTVQGLEWELWTGTVQTWGIFSFVATSSIPSYDADLNEFFTYLIANQGVSSSQYLTAVQGGTEPFAGSATLTSSTFSVSVVEGDAPVTTTIKSSSSTSVVLSTSTILPSSTKEASTTIPVVESSTSPVTTKETSATSTAASPSSTGACGSLYSQCGGQAFTGSTCCVSGATCTFNNAYYSQCLLASASGTSSAEIASTSSAIDIVSTAIDVDASSSTFAGSTTVSSAPASTSSGASSSNLQPFTGALGDISAPTVTAGGRNFLVATVTDGSSFYTLDEALSRSCADQHNLCADKSNAFPNGAAEFTVGECDTQMNACYASI